MQTFHLAVYGRPRWGQVLQLWLFLSPHTRLLLTHVRCGDRILQPCQVCSQSWFQFPCQYVFVYMSSYFKYASLPAPLHSFPTREKQLKTALPRLSVWKHRFCFDTGTKAMTHFDVETHWCESSGTWRADRGLRSLLPHRVKRPPEGLQT